MERSVIVINWFGLAVALAFSLPHSRGRWCGGGGQVHSLGLQEVSMGDVPPTLTGIKFLNTPLNNEVRTKPARSLVETLSLFVVSATALPDSDRRRPILSTCLWLVDGLVAG
jgi:hypothetical protein